MILSKYGVARHVFIPLVKRSVADFAIGADYTPVAGDVKISKDGGAAANVTNLPVAIVMGNAAIWDFSLTATEMQAAQILITVADAATKAVEDSMFVIESYGNASAQHAVDLSDSVRMGLTDIAAITTTAQAELTAVPASNASPLAKLNWLFLLARNKITQTATTQLVKANDGTTTVGTSAVSDDGTTGTRGVFT